MRDRIRFTALIACMTLILVASTARAMGIVAYENGLTEKLATAAPDEKLPLFIGISNPYPLEELYAEVRDMPLPERRRHTIETLDAHFTQQAEEIETWLENARDAGRADHLHAVWIAQGFVVHLEADRIPDLAGLNHVARLRYDPPRSFESVNDELVAPGAETPMPDELDEVSWAIPYIGADDLWDLGYTGSNVLVAMIDSGVAPHDDLEDHQWTNVDEIPGNGIDDDLNGYVDDIHGWNFYDDNPDISDVQGHGTKCTGIVCGDGTLGTQTGMAPDATWMMIRNYADGWVSEGTRAAAVQYALSNGAQVISCSMSYKYDYPYVPDYVTHRYTYLALLAAGVISANSVGNNNPGPVPWNIAAPGNCPPPWLHPDQIVRGGVTGVIGIGAHNSSGLLETYTGDGPAAWEELIYPDVFRDYPWNNGASQGLLKPDLLAPTGVPTTDNFPENEYTTFTGTSASAPVAAGAMVLLRDIHPQAPPEALAEALLMTADDGGEPGFDNQYGAGLLRVDLAHQYLDNMFEYGSLHVVIQTNMAPPDSFQVTIGDDEIVRDYFATLIGNVERVMPGVYQVAIDLPGNDRRVFSGVDIQPSAQTSLIVQADQQAFSVLPDEIERTANNPEEMQLEFTVDNPWTDSITMAVTAIPHGGADWAEDMEFTLPADSVRCAAASPDGLLAAGNTGDLPSFWLYNYADHAVSPYEQPARFGTGGAEACSYTMGSEFGMLFERKVQVCDSNEQPPFAIVDSLQIPESIADPAGLAFRDDSYFVADNSSRRLVRFAWDDGSILDMYELDGITARSLSASPGETDDATGIIYILGRDLVGECFIATLDIDSGELRTRPALRPEIGYNPVTMAYDVYREEITMGPALVDDESVVREYWDRLRHNPAESYSPLEFPPGSSSLFVTLNGLVFQQEVSNQFDLVFRSDEGGRQDTSSVTIVRNYTGVAEPVPGTTLPESAMLEKVYPNPFNSTVTLEYALPVPGRVSLAVYDILGREVVKLDGGHHAAGRYSVTWAANGLASGIYFAAFQTGDTRDSCKLMLLK